ncbi:MAG: NAD(P)-dependent oxidoreductase [Proteobacteria bacterium]|nr:NAD(P)-dependent oxidoreductase [Desulfobacteraceae bacterium]MBU4013878.1 NAD(P)-dependent oxidoreductase [Pseudomonadota bacterium]MBU4068189.1 NAD(P)-dependent oxidoreductase [Pseudomonadota bacterium]MBU4128241.1 NAD(P)-dependent oxidoreductase [Pseudomonadota bacterium]
MILITGAGGFIGKGLVAHCKNMGIPYVPLYRSEDVKICKEGWYLDLTNKGHFDLLNNELEEFPHTIIHLAGSTDIALGKNENELIDCPQPGKQNIYYTYYNNILSTINLVSFCQKNNIRHFIFASSQTVYGMPQEDALTEGSRCQPLEHYAASKLCNEIILEVASRQGLKVTILRFPGVYGEERKSGVVYNFCKSALIDKKINVVTEFPLPIDVIHIQDVVEAFIKAIHHRGEEFTCLNISTGEPCNLNILADSIVELVPGCEVQHGDVSQPIVNMQPSRANILLGWKAMPRKVRLQEMLNSIRVQSESNFLTKG